MDSNSAFFGVFLLFYCLIFIIAILASVFWVWMLVECVTREPAEGKDKTTWTLVIALTHVIGAAIYFFVRRPERKRIVGQ